MKKILHEMIYTLKYKVYKIKYPIPMVIDRLKTSEMIANNNSLSIARFGDGELGQILRKDDIGFQHYNSDLAQRLQEILLSEPDSHILICIPDLFQSLSKLKDKPRNYWQQWILQNRFGLYKIIPSQTYGDSLVTRLYLPWVNTSDEETIVCNIKSAWNGKQVIIVEGKKTRWGIGNDLLENAASVWRILCPSINAYEKYYQILNLCKYHATNDCVFLLALGPTATVLAYDLAKDGKRALDLGHLDLQYDYLNQKATERTTIAGKFNNELTGDPVEACSDPLYINSVIEDISDE